MKYIYLLGATGSIGTQTLDVIRNNKNLFKLVGVSLGRDTAQDQKIIDEFSPEVVCLRFNGQEQELDLRDSKVVYGDSGLEYVASYKKYDNELVINALMGHVGLMPTVSAIKAKKNVALANKETIVMAGDIINSLKKEYGVDVLPIDSEHNAVFECLRGEHISEVNKVYITASGGAFRDREFSTLKSATVKDALNHPNWSMGSKITIDSATLVNKALEMIEAHYLFDIDIHNIIPILHRQSIVHGFVEFKDASFKACFSKTDMRIPILIAMSYPNRLDRVPDSKLSIKSLATLTFEEMPFDNPRYDIFNTAIKAVELGGIMPTVFNAANEAYVKLFLEGKIGFMDILDGVKASLGLIKQEKNPSVERLLEIDKIIQEKIIKNQGVLNGYSN